MIKSTYLFLIYYPILLNLLLIYLISIPSKFNKFRPINLTLLLIILTIVISIKLNLIINSWGSYIIFLIIIGGLIIIFIYIIRIANNEFIKINLNFIFINLIKLIPILIIFFFIFKNFFFYLNNNLLWRNYLFNNFNNLNFFEIYSLYYSKIIIFLINYLFYSIICIINICYKIKLPLRQNLFN